MYSLVIICAAENLTLVNEYFESIGQGSNYLTVKLTSSGETITHYGARSDVSDELKNTLESANLSATLEFAQNEIPYDHFMRVLEANNLSTFE